MIQDLGAEGSLYYTDTNVLHYEGPSAFPIPTVLHLPHLCKTFELAEGYDAVVSGCKTCVPNNKRFDLANNKRSLVPYAHQSTPWDDMLCRNGLAGTMVCTTFALVPDRWVSTLGKSSTGSPLETEEPKVSKAR